jgi:hypothetical protein
LVDNEGIRTGGSELEIFQQENFAANADKCGRAFGATAGKERICDGK